MMGFSIANSTAISTFFSSVAKTGTITCCPQAICASPYKRPTAQAFSPSRQTIQISSQNFVYGDGPARFGVSAAAWKSPTYPALSSPSAALRVRSSSSLDSKPRACGSALVSSSPTITATRRRLLSALSRQSGLQTPLLSSPPRKIRFVSASLLQSFRPRFRLKPPASPSLSRTNHRSARMACRASEDKSRVSAFVRKLNFADPIQVPSARGPFGRHGRHSPCSPRRYRAAHRPLRMDHRLGRRTLVESVACGGRKCRP